MTVSRSASRGADRKRHHKPAPITAAITTIVATIGSFWLLCVSKGVAAIAGEDAERTRAALVAAGLEELEETAAGSSSAILRRRPDSVSRFRRCKSARISAALW